MLKSLYKRSLQLIVLGLLLTVALSFGEGPKIVLAEQVAAWVVVAGMLLAIFTPYIAMFIQFLKEDIFYWTMVSA